MWLKNFLLKEVFRQYYIFQQKQTFTRLTQKSIILTDSEYSMKAIYFYFYSLLSFKKVALAVAYPLFEKNIKTNLPSSKNSYKYLKHVSYFLTVSSSRPEKNVLRVLDALNENDFFVKNPNWTYILTGIHKNLELLITKRYKKIRPNLLLLDYVSNEQLNFLYKYSSFSVYASLNEGYGYPIMESLSRGSPVALSNLTSLPEIGKEGCVYFNPRNKKTIYSSIQNLVGDPKKRNFLRKKGRVYFERFNKKNEREWSELLQRLLF
jgi:glycosyltransferase involved in cell wall biosynthesis